VQANLSHWAGWSFLAGSSVVWAGSVHFGGKLFFYLGGFGPLWRVQSYVIHCTSEFNRHRQTTFKVYRVVEVCDRSKVIVGRVPCCSPSKRPRSRSVSRTIVARPSSSSLLNHDVDDGNSTRRCSMLFLSWRGGR
jgi:hypothetical protein